MANKRFFAGTVLEGGFINLRPLLRPLKQPLENLEHRTSNRVSEPPTHPPNPLKTYGASEIKLSSQGMGRCDPVELFLKFHFDPMSSS